jgi:3-oxoacyl-[acyl-carrier protein] reductase
VIYGGGGSIGGAVETALVDALDEQSVERHADAVAAKAGSIDIALNAVEAIPAQRARTGTLLGRFPMLAEIANYAAFVASDRASAMTRAIANLTCGSLVD